MAKGHRKKRAWNMSNPLYRYLHGGAKKTRRSKSRGGNMARRKKAGVSRSGFGLSGFKSGMVGMALLGLGVAAANKRFAPQVIPFQAPVLGFLIGGPVAAITAYLHDGTSSGGATSGGIELNG